MILKILLAIIVLGAIGWVLYLMPPNVLKFLVTTGLFAGVIAYMVIETNREI